MFDGKAFGEEIVATVKDYVSRTVEPLLKRIEELEAKPVPQPEVGKADIAAIVADVESLRKAVSEWKAPEPIALPDIGAMVSEAVTRQMPEPLPANEVDMEAVAALVNRAVGEQMPDPTPAEKVDPEQVAAFVKLEAERILSAWDRPQDGKSVKVDDVLPLIEEQVSQHVAKAVSTLPVPVSVKAGFIDRDGRLVLTMSDGSLDLLGEVVGKNGADADWSKIDLRLKEMFDAWPKPKDGVDGLGFKDLNLEFREEAAYFVYVGEEIQKEARLPIPYDRGVFREQTVYYKGNTVTWGGSTWIAKTDEPEGKPDAPNSGWRLCNKKGRDGKDADGNSSTKPVKAK